MHQRQSGNEQVSRSSYSGLRYSGRYITLIFAYFLISKICLSYWFVLLSRNLDVESNVELKKWTRMRIKSGNWHCKKLWSNGEERSYKKWRLNIKDNIVWIVLFSGWRTAVVYLFFKRFCRKSNFPFPILFCDKFSPQQKTKPNLKISKSSCALKGCRTSGQFAIQPSADFLVVFSP